MKETRKNWPKEFHKGDTVKVIADHWKRKVPEGQLKFRNQPGKIFGITCFENGTALSMKVDFGKHGEFLFPPHLLRKVKAA